MATFVSRRLAAASASHYAHPRFLQRVLKGVHAATPGRPGGLTDSDDTARFARADRFHWRNPLSSVLPVEPEATAVGAIVASAAMKYGMEDDVVASIDLPSAATVPLHMDFTVARQSRGIGS
jgi:hypothetical protein